MKRDPADLEASRQRLNIPDGWLWSECAANCGDIVWHPELAPMGVLAVCSNRCAWTLLRSADVAP